MKRIKLLIIIGTRPEAIKMAPVVLALKKDSLFETRVLATGQHTTICDEVFDIFGIIPDYRLNVLSHGQSLTSLSNKLLDGISNILVKEKFDCVVVHGDTTSAFCGAVAGFYNQNDICHIEAGLRSNNFKAPFPEEFNRVCIDSFANILFPPTELAFENLLRENKKSNQMIVTGNTAIDALKLSIKPSYSDSIIEWCSGYKMLLLTTHRRENSGDGFKNIFSAVSEIVNSNTDVKVVYPMHPNPAIRELAKLILGSNERVMMIEPQRVDVFHNLMNHSYLILTDSGGIQEEAPSLGKPVLVLRDVTERPEGVAAGTLKIIGTNTHKIVTETNLLLTNEKEYKKMAEAINPYGDGRASDRIVEFLKQKYETK